jgi:Translation elongation factors (GTPases)
MGSVDAGTSAGDASKEAREHHMSVEMSAATTTFMDESYTFIDCPGSIEFIHDMRAALPAVDGRGRGVRGRREKGSAVAAAAART